MRRRSAPFAFDRVVIIDVIVNVIDVGHGKPQRSNARIGFTVVNKGESNSSSNPLWKKLNNQFKRKTTAGADYHEDSDGSSMYVRNARFTAGAKQLFLSGTPLRPLGGGYSSLHPI